MHAVTHRFIPPHILYQCPFMIFIILVTSPFSIIIAVPLFYYKKGEVYLQVKVTLLVAAPCR